MIDTHTHLYFPEFGESIDQIMNQALNSGVKHFILPNVDIESIEQVKNLHKSYPQITSMAMGLHPTEVKEDWQEVIKIINNELKTNNYIAVGEVGMDLYWDSTFKQEQIEAFELQLKMAEGLNLPVIIHSRSATDETVECIDEIKPTVPLIFHSFTGSVDDVKKIREVCDPYFGINGVVTYKNAQDLREAVREISLEKIVLETDAPFLTPVPHRGKRNDSSYLCHIRDKISEILSVSSEKVDLITDKNARAIFGL